MNKYILFCICAVMVIAGCKDDSSGPQSSSSGKKTKKSDRNLLITKENAYSDLFMDSMAVEKFILQQKINDTLANDFRLFYNRRNFQFAWFSTTGVNEQTLSFRSLYDYSKDSGVARKSLDNRLDDILTNDSLGILSANANTIKTELLLTWRFINYISHKYSRKSARNYAMGEMIPAVKTPVNEMATSALDGKKNDADIRTDAYNALKKHLELYSRIANEGGFPQVPSTKKIFKKGESGTIIKHIKLRLAAERLFPGNDTSNNFNEELADAVKESQQRYGLKADGYIGAAWVKQLNVSAADRMETILINMERMKWMHEEPEGRLIMVNIPEFRLHVRDRKSDAFDMDIVVGKEGSSTINFSGTLNQVVFNPYWNVPRSIVTKEVMPGIEKNDHYLEEHQMEITGEEDGLPVVRQLPGDHNALGRVKFLFPNSYNIYFHDTPEKELFKRTKRAYSHGCIRLSDPMKMANYLLEEDLDWSGTRIDSVLATDQEKYVKVKDPVPVIIAYFTAWVNNQGRIEFREDIYNHDKKMSGKLFGKANRAVELTKL